MKNILYFICMLLTLSSNVAGQKEIQFDFLTKQFKVGGDEFTNSKLVLDYNVSYRFTITNVDTRLYSDFSISTEQRDFFEQESDERFREILTMPLTEPGGAKNDTPDSLIQAVNKKLTELEEDVSSLLKPFEERIPLNAINVINNKGSENYIRSLGALLPTEVTEQLERIMQEQEREREKREALTYYKAQFAVLKGKADLVYALFNEIERMKELNNSLVALSNQYTISKNEIRAQTEQLEEQYQDVLPRKNLIMDEFENASISFNEYLTLFRKDKTITGLQEENPELVPAVDDLVNSVEVKQQFEESFNEKIGYKKMVEAVITMIFRLKNETVVDLYFIGQITPTKDQLQLNIEYKEANPKRVSDGFNTSRKYPYTFDVKGGAKITVSTGIMLRGFLYDRSYSIYPAVDSGYSVIKQDKNRNLIQPTVGALMHVLYRSSTSLTGGFTWGIGTDMTALSNMTIFIGGSVVIGRQERFIISGGFASTPVSYLKGKYSTDTPVKNTDIDQDGITKNAFRPGIFVGFTYNLIGPKKEQLGAPSGN